MTAGREPLEASTFSAYVGSAFALDGVALLLVEVQLGPLQPGAPREQPFSLLLSGELELAQATYVLTHPELGELAVFLVPQPPVDGRARYEAVFN